MLFQRRVLTELLRNALSTAVALTAITLLVVSASIVHKLEALSFLGFAKSLPIFAAASLDLVVPVAVLVAVVITYGRIAADNEYDTLRASGVHPVHWLTPGLVFGGIMAVGMLITMDYAKPWAERAQRRMSKDVDIAAVLEQKLGNGEPARLGSWVISVDDVTEDGGLRGLRVQLIGEEDDVTREVVAETGEAVLSEDNAELMLVLYDWRGVKGMLGSGTRTDMTLQLKHNEADLKISHFTTPQVRAWLERPDALLPPSFSRAELSGEMHLRMASAITCILFVLLGMPVALGSKRADKVRAFLISFLLVLFVYYPSLKVSVALIEVGRMPPVLAAWTGTTLLGVLGLALTVRTLRR